METDQFIKWAGLLVPARLAGNAPIWQPIIFSREVVISGDSIQIGQDRVEMSVTGMSLAAQDRNSRVVRSELQIVDAYIRSASAQKLTVTFTGPDDFR